MEKILLNRPNSVPSFICNDLDPLPPSMLDLNLRKVVGTGSSESWSSNSSIILSGSCSGKLKSSSDSIYLPSCLLISVCRPRLTFETSAKSVKLFFTLTVMLGLVLNEPSKLPFGLSPGVSAS